jgi:DNA polymerase III epsilon subunit-like protein
LAKVTTICFTDGETTGFDPHTEHIIQLAMIKVQHVPDNPLELKVLVELERKWVLPEGAVVSREVAAINGYDPETWEKEAVDRREALAEYFGHLEWSAFGGQNPTFDYNFIDIEARRQGVQWPKRRHYRLWAVEMLAVPLCELGYLRDVKQETMAAFFKLGDQTHDALDDVRQSVEIYRRLFWLHCRGLTDEHVQDAVNLGD